MLFVFTTNFQLPRLLCGTFETWAKLSSARTHKEEVDFAVCAANFGYVFGFKLFLSFMAMFWRERVRKKERKERADCVFEDMYY